MSTATLQIDDLRHEVTAAISTIENKIDRLGAAAPASMGSDAFVGQYVIARTYSAGVFAGTLEKREGKEIMLNNARRLWYWAGAASLSQLAVTGTSRPLECKFPVAVPSVLLTECIEIVACTDAGRASIEAVPEWKV
jgi:hypothetical protein